MSKSHLRSTTAVLLTTLVAATPALSQEAEADAGFLGTLFLTFGKRDVSINSPVSTTVLDEDELEDRQASTLAEALVTIPGVTLANGYSAQAAGVNIRGFGTDSTFGGDQSVVFLEDGATVGAEPIYRISTQAFTDPLLYKSVEVRRGTIGSFEFGSGITGGVILSETKDASDFTGGEPGFKIGQTLEYSSNGNGTTSSTTLAWQPSENFELLGNYTIRKSNDYSNGDGAVQVQTRNDIPSALLKGKLTFGQDNDHALTLSLKQSTTEELDVSYNFINPLTFRRVNRKHEDRVASLTYEYTPADNDLIDFTAQLTRSNRITENSLIPGVDYSTFSAFYDSDFEYTTTKLLLKNNAFFMTGGLSHDLTVGAEFINRDRANTEAGGAGGGTDKRFAFFVIDDISITDALTITPALRYEKQDLNPDATDDGAFPTPNPIADTFSNDAWMGGIAAKYEFENGLSVFGSAAYSAGLPSIGSPSSTLQKSRTVEVGASYASTDVFSAGDNLSIRGNLYQTHVWSTTSSSIDYTDTSGLELEASYGLESGLYFDLNANIVDGKETYFPGQADGVQSRVWRSLPSDSVNLTIGKKWGDVFDLSWEVVHHAASKRHNIGRTSHTVEDVKSWSSNNLRATYKPQEGLLEGFEMRVGIDNIFDVNYRPNLATYDAPGRNIKFTLSKVF